MAVLGGMPTTVLGSKRSANCALAAYFVHSTRPKIQGLVSHDSIVDRQFVIACVRHGVTNIMFMCRALPSTVVRRRKKCGEPSCTECRGFVEKRSSYGKILKILLRKDSLPHRSTCFIQIS